MSAFFRRILAVDPNSLSSSRRSTHTHVIGQPGTGKSRALESWILQDVQAKRGVGVIDPHGDLFNNLLVKISLIPEVWPRVVVLNPLDPKWTAVFNPLEAIRGFSHERLSLFMTDVVMKIWKLDVANSPRMVWLLTNSFLALSELGLTLLDLPRFLLDGDLRENLVPRISNESARAYFLYEFPRNQAAVHQWVTPVLNKIGGLIFDPDARLMLAGTSTIDFRSIMDDGDILLVNLPKGVLGEGASALLGAFIVAYIQKAALSRAETGRRKPFHLYLDEFQNYTTDNVKDILSESRKYALSLTLAHQYLDQLSPDMASAVLNTAGTLVCFRVGVQDALRLVKEIFPSPDFLSVKKSGVKMDRFGNWSLLSFEERKEALGWEGMALGLAQVPARQFWARSHGSKIPTRQRTLDVPDIPLTPETLARLGALLDASGERFGKLKRIAREELTQNRRTWAVKGNTSGGSAEDEDLFFWMD